MNGLIDIHVHAIRATGITRDNGSRCPTPEELVLMMDEREIDLAVVLGLVSPECAFGYLTPEEILETCADYPDRLIPYCNLDPRMVGNAPTSDFSRLLAHYKGLGCKGVGEYCPNLPFDDPLNLNVFRQVEASGLPLTFHVAPTLGGAYGCYDDLGLPRLEKVLQAFPKLTFLGHSQPFWAEISADVTNETRGGYPTGPVTPGRVVELMRRYPNLHGDLSAGSGYNAINRDPKFGLRFLDEFQDRLYFGTDIANYPQNTPIVELFRRYRDQRLVSADALDKICWRNAARLLGFGQ